jgi:leucyl aminopeptidase
LQIEFRNDSLESLQCHVLAACIFEGASAAEGAAAAWPEETLKLLAQLQASGELKGKEGECTLIHRPAGLKAARLLAVGAGKLDRFNDTRLRRLAGTGVRYARARALGEVAWAVAGNNAGPEAVQAIVEGAILADYDSDPYRTDREEARKIERLLMVTAGREPTEAEKAAAERGRTIAEAQNFVRDLVNEPSNLLTPAELARRAQQMAQQFGLECQVFGPDEIRAMKMGAFWAVAQGSDEPPRLIVVRYNPPDASAAPVIGLIGKGITFDTGGISIKPATDMHEMKTDMAGAATMLGVMRAIAQLKPRVRVVAVIAAAENMPSGKAYRPGDVVTSMSGKTIEVLNTDAEGRLTLADALTYARRQGCTVLIDAATLTGAVMVALGNITTGVFGWDKDWVNRVLSSGAAVGEKMWQLPVDEDYRELYKSTIADFANTGGRYGGAITAAMFVGEFAGDTPWVHLDIAGTRWSNEEKPYLAKGPTGAPLRTLVHLVTQTAL